MNVEFLIHGTLSDGQSSWKEIDVDYCLRFYTPTTTNEVMICEVEKHENGGISSYYNYLRYNNLTALSGRSGSYFGITVRVDGAICCDVVNMYHLLDTLFTKCIVGSILDIKNNVYFYTCNSFKAKDSVLKDIEKKFFGMFSALFISNDDFSLIPNSYTHKNGSFNLNLDDVTKGLSGEILLAGNRLCVSPLFLAKQFQNVQSQILAIQNEAAQKIKSSQEDCAKLIQAKTQEMEQANITASSSKAQLKQEIDHLKGQLQVKEKELEDIRAEFEKQKLNAEINQTTKELKEPIMKLAGLMADRFCEVDVLDTEIGYSRRKKNDGDTQSLFLSSYWKPLSAIAVVLAFAVSAWFAMFVIKSQDKLFADLKIIQKQLENLLSKTEDNSKHDIKINIDDSARYDFNKLTIDIVEKRNTDAGLKFNHIYTFRILGGKYPVNGTWTINGIMLPETKYKVVNEVGTDLLIKYLTTDSQVVSSRKIKVIN